MDRSYRNNSVKQFYVMVLLFLLLATLASAQDRSQARSMTISDRGIVATSQTLASQAGAQVLARGGSAIDAAIAANATLGVVEPERGGIGGDLFVIYYEAKTGKLTGINASGWAPKGLTIDVLKSMGNTTMPQLGIQSVTVPGCVDGWAKLHQKFGKLPWKDIFAPAIYYAKNGFPVTEIIHETWHEETAKLADDAERPARLPAERRVAQAGRDLPQSRTRRGHGTDRQPGALGLLQGRHRQSHPEDQRAPGRQDVGRRLERVLQRMGAAHLHRISRLEGLRAAAQRPGHRPARDVEHSFAISAGHLRAARRRGTARANRGAEAGLRRPAPLPGRSAHQQGAGRRPDLAGLRAASAPS